MNKKYVRSPLNHLGNKYRILDILLDTFPKDENLVMIDVFGGSGLVGVNSLSSKIEYNEFDKNLYEIVKILSCVEPEAIIKNIEKIMKKNNLTADLSDNSEVNRKCFLELREKYNENPKNVYELMTLVLFGFNSQIRFNAKGKFNIPVGKSGLNNYRKNNLINFSKESAKKTISFNNLDFEQFVAKMVSKYKNDECYFYFDPPYLISQATYNSLWDEEAEKRLLKVIEQLINYGYKVILSNFLSSGDVENELLKNFLDKNKLFVQNLDVNYNKSNYQRKHRKSLEILARNY